MRLSKTVSADDCREARRLQREAIKQAAIDPVTGTIDINILTTGRFPPPPLRQFPPTQFIDFICCLRCEQQYEKAS